MWAVFVFWGGNSALWGFVKREPSVRTQQPLLKKEGQLLPFPVGGYGVRPFVFLRLFPCEESLGACHSISTNGP